MPDPPEAPPPLPRSPAIMDTAGAALMVVDLQERLLPAVAGGDRVAWNARRLIDGAALLGVPAAWTEQSPEKLGGTVEPLAKRLAETGAVGPLAKLAFSCGEHGGVVQQWLDEGRRWVLLCGVETHVCIQQTALDYLAAGLDVHVAVDAVGSRHALDHETALRRIEASGATLTTVEAALCEWTATARSPQFRQVSALLKEEPPVG